MAGKYDAILDAEQGSAPAPVSSYDSVLDQEVQQNQQRVRTVFEKALAVNPDQAAQAKRLASSTGLPADTVSRNLDEVKRKEQARMLDLAQMAQDSPVLARQLMDPAFTNQAHDDIPNLVEVNRTLAGTAGDAAVALTKGAVALPQAFVGIADLVTGGYAGKAVQTLGVDFKGAQDILGGMYSPAQQAANKQVDQATGFLDTLATMVQNPSTIAATVVESLPQMLGGAAIGRKVLGAGAKMVGAGAAGPNLPGLLARQFGEKTAAVIAGAFGEGTIAAGSSAENLRSENSDGLISAKDALASIGTGAGTMLFGVAGGRLAQRLGLEDIDTALVSRGLSTEAAGELKDGFVKAIVKGGISEGLFEEMPQSIQEQMWQNFANDKPLGEGVGKAAAQGVLAGFSMGGGFQAIGRVTDHFGAIDNAQARGQQLQDAMAAASSALLRERNPEEFRTLVQQMAEGAEGAPTEVFVDAEVLNQLAPEVLAQLPGVAEQMQAALAANDVVSISVADVLTVAPGTPLEAMLVEHARVGDARAMSQFEAKEAGAKAQEFLAQESQRVIQQAADQRAMQESHDRVKQTLLERLNTVGRDRPAVNESTATLYASLYTTLAGELGVTPEEAFTKYGVNIVGQTGQGSVLNAGSMPGEVSVEGYHFSTADRTTLSTAMYGTGLKGSARDEILNNPDQRLKERLSFYFDKGTGIRPESGVGGRAHRVQLSGVYDADADPLKLRTGNARELESKLLDLGYKGYMNRMDGTQPGQVIMLGAQTFTPELLGALSRIDNGQRVAPIAAAAPQWQTQATGEPDMLQAKLARMQAMPAWADYDLRIDGNELQVREKGGVLEQSAKAKPGADAPGVGLEEGNKLGFWPALRVKLTGKLKLPEKAPILTGTTNVNASKQIAAIDGILKKFPKAAESTAEWTKMMAYALGSTEVPIPPYAFIRDINGTGSLDKLRTLTQGQIDDASHGFENAAEFRRAYIAGELGVETTGKLFMWSFLSRGVSPYTQEALFIDAFNGADKWIAMAARGEFTEAVFPEYEQWAKSVAPKGSGQPGAGATHNLNAFGQDFLFKMSRVGKDGKTHMQRLHDMMADPAQTGKNIRREFATFGEGVGIDNKVVSFTLLVAGFNDVMVLDRVQIRQLWDDGRFNGVNLYDGVSENKMVTAKDGVAKMKPVKLAGSSLNNLAEGARGILVYEAIERGLEGKIQQLYTELGRPQDGSIGRYHWETWVADSQQEASHGTLGAILADAKGDDQAIASVSAKQGEYGAYEYGALYNRDSEGTPWFGYDLPSGSGFAFSVPAFRAFLEDIKRPATGVVPTKFKVTESGNAPWYTRPEVNQDQLEERARYWADRAGGSGEGQRAIEEALQQQTADGAGPGAGSQSNQGEVNGRYEQAGNGSGRPAGGNLAPLEGAPSVPGFQGPDSRVVAVAEQYARDNGIDLKRQAEYVKVDPERASRIAAAYEAMAHNPQDPAVKEAYDNLIRQTLAQYQALEAAGYKFWFIDFGQPSNAEYASTPWNAMRDMRANQQMGVFPTNDGFGSGDFSPEANPLLADTGLQWPKGGPDGPLQPVLANDLFRAVHDAFGHGLEGAGFRADGEENAWQAHSRLFTGSALGAITTETRGQNSWLNFGPNGEANQTAKVEDTVFADQKTGLMPEWTWTEGRAGDQTEVLEQGAQGTFNPKTFELALNENSNMSTVHHEMAHAYLEIITKIASEPGAPQGIVDQVERFLKWQGIADLATWQAMTLDQKRPHHEALAENYEHYLLTGKAPSVELQPLFRKLKAYMLNAYRTLKAFFEANPDVGQTLPPEMVQFYDRMLASEEQIRVAEEVAGLVPNEDATAEAVEKLTARSLRDLKWTVNARNKEIKRLQAEAKELRKGIEAEVTAEVNAMPEFAAKAALDQIRKDTKAAPGEMELATVADSFGYPDADTMLQAIDAVGKKSDVIEGMTDQRMLERHGDLIDQRSIEQAANEAVHNEARARSLATELKSQGEMLNPRVDTGEVNAKGSKITVNAIVEAAKQFAANVVARTPLRDLKSKAWQHTAAERRAGKRWTEATAAGKTQDAVKAKQDQVLNNAAAKAALDAQTEMGKILTFFKRVIKDNNEKVVDKGRDPDVVNAARAVLAAYGVAPKAGKTALEYMALVEKNDPAMFAALAPSVQGALNMAQPLDALTMEELRALHEEIQAMWHLAKRSRQMEVDGNMMDMQDAEDELQARMQAIGVPLTMPGDSGAVTPREEFARKLQHVGSLLRRTEQWAQGMGAEFTRLVFQPIKDAANAYRTDRVTYRKAYQALVDNVAPALTKGTIDAPELGYTFGKGHNGIGHAELLHAILHTGNESNKRKLLLGRGWATENADGTVNTDRWDAFLKRAHDTGLLSKAHYDFAQGVWDLLEKTKPLAQKTHRDVFGRYFAEVTADSFDTPFGSYAGGYVPAQADPRIVQDADLRKLAESENENMAFSFPGTNKGFTKGRVEYNRPLLLDLRTIGQHIDKVLLFSHMEPAVRDVNKLLSRKGVSYSLGRIDPTIYAGMLTPWLNRSARQIVETPIVGDGGISRVLSAARGRAGMALMFANISNAVQQVTGFSTAFAKLKADGLESHMMRSTAQFIASPKKTAKAVSDASEFMAGRMENEISAINDAMDAILLDPNLYQKAQAWTAKHAYFLQTAIANTMEPVIWTAGYNAALEKGMDEKGAVRYADGLIRQTQGSTLPEDVSRIETGPAYARVFTQFIGYFNMIANTNATALKQISQEMGLKKGAGKALMVVTMGMLVPIWVAEAIAQAMRGGPDDEDDDGYLDDWLAAVFGMGTIKGAFAMVPFVGQLANAGINRFNGNPADDKVSLSPAVSLLESAVGVPVDVYTAITDPDKLNKRNAVRDVASAVSIATGLPAVALARPLGYLAGMVDDKIAPTSNADMARGLVTGTASPASK